MFEAAVRSGRTLQSVVSSTTEYQHFWTVFVPSGNDSQQSTKRTEKPGTENDSRDTKRLREQVRTLQSDRDKAVEELRRQSGGSSRAGGSFVRGNDGRRKENAQSDPISNWGGRPRR